MPAIRYTNNTGAKLPSVTTIIGGNLGWSQNALMYWAWKQGCDGKDYKDTSQKAADAGTVAHKLIESAITGEPVSQKETVFWEDDAKAKGEQAMTNFLRWSEMVRFRPILSETSIVSEKYQYGGTIDCIATIDGKRSLLDWKSGSGVYPNHIIQLEAYRKLHDENFPDTPIEGGFYILRIDKDSAAFDWHYRQEVPEAWRAFLLLLELHSLKGKIK